MRKVTCLEGPGRLTKSGRTRPFRPSPRPSGPQTRPEGTRGSNRPWGARQSDGPSPFTRRANSASARLAKEQGETGAGDDCRAGEQRGAWPVSPDEQANEQRPDEQQIVKRRDGGRRSEPQRFRPEVLREAIGKPARGQ